MAGDAHLVGGLAFRTTEDAMRAVVSNAGDVIDLIPDGETGPRASWAANPDFPKLLERTKGFSSIPGAPPLDLIGGLIGWDLEEGVSPDDIDLQTLTLAEPAIESYEVFKQLREEGVIAADMRFQVSLPTPFAVLGTNVVPQAHAALGPVFERAMLADLKRIVDAVPAEDLAIQWDVAVEFGYLEHYHSQGNSPEAIKNVDARLARLCNAVPEPVALCLHWCYGAPYDVHFDDPSDTGLMVELANSTFPLIERSLQRLHLPVPIQRDDADYFAPLRNLKLPKETRLYLGLVHWEDGVEGATRRIAAAKTAVDDFGVATECGSARTPTEPTSLLRLHNDVARISEQSDFPGVDVPEHATPHEGETREEVDARLRSFAEQVPCPICGVEAGAPCDGGESAAPMLRPHLPRYTDAVLDLGDKQRA